MIRISREQRKSASVAKPAAWAMSLALAMVITSAAHAQWTQYGGPGQDFKVEDVGIAKTWPSEGPPRLWSRKLGEGYSSILADEGRLYTMYRAGENEVVICLNAASGKTMWEYPYASQPAKGHLAEYGNGPNATPLLSGDRLYTIGVAGVMHCLDSRTGKVLWKHDLWKEFEGNLIEFGYSSSPIAHENSVIALVGGKGASIVAFDKKDGHVLWKNLDFKNSFSTPLIMKIHGEDQLVTFMTTEVIGVDPDTGQLKWQYPSINEWKQNICMPVLADDDLLFISSLKAGTHGLKILKNNGDFTVEEIWSTSKVEFMYISFVRFGDYIYGSSGFRSAPIMSALNVRTGEIAWRKRGFAQANLVGVGNRVIMLDEEGNLILATPTPEGLTVHSQVKLLRHPAWTAPTIVGKTIYIRDLVDIMALDLG